MTPPKSAAQLELVQARELICRFLGSASVADHLGDIRDAEDYLWQALGFNRADMSEARAAIEENDDGIALPLARYMGVTFDLPFPDYILENDDE